VLRSQKIFNQGKGPGAYFYIFRPGFESAKKVKRNRTESGIDELHSSRYPENLYNRVSILGVDMSDGSYLGCKRILLLMVPSPNAELVYYAQENVFNQCLLGIF
jgi:hypothetical protein